MKKSSLRLFYQSLKKPHAAFKYSLKLIKIKSW